MGKSDEDIISRVQDGNKEEYSVLVERYHKQIFNLMYRYTRSDLDAADLSQEVFIRAYEKLGSFKRGRRFFPWLYTLALNRAHDWRRKQIRQDRYKKEICSQVSDVHMACSQQERMLQGREDMTRLQQALLELPDQTREILILRYQHNSSVRETARIFSITESAVKMRTSRGLRQLLELIQVGNHDQ